MTVLATVLYIVATVAIMGILPTNELAASTSPFADAAGQVFGSPREQRTQDYVAGAFG